MKYYPLLLLFYLLVHPALSSKPNVVVFLVDDLGYIDIGANNPDCFYETPHINKLAATLMTIFNGNKRLYCPDKRKSGGVFWKNLHIELGSSPISW